MGDKTMNKNKTPKESETDRTANGEEVASTDLLCLDILDNLPQEKKLELLDDAIHKLNFEKRFAGLTKNQHSHLRGEMTKETHEHLISLDEERRDKAFNEYARALYFRQCAWINYLNGFTDDIPCEA